MATVNLIVEQSSDDAQEATGGAVTLDGEYPLANDVDEWLAVRFQNVTIPAGSTINTATLTMYATGTHDDIHVDIYAEDGDAGTFTTDANNISGRSMTTGKADWDSDGVGAGDENVSVVTPIQEVISGGNWASGYDLALILDAQASCDFSFWAYDVSDTNCPRLDIDYTAPSGATTQFYHYAHH